MNATAHIEKIQSAGGVVVGVDIAKTVFQLCVADTKWRRLSAHRLSRNQFERWFDNREVALVVMEACGMAHHWSRWLAKRGIEAIMLPANYVRAYRKRNKTDAADASALLEAARCADIEPVRVKTVEQQALQALHRARSLWMGWRTGQINALRGACREFGLDISQGAKKGLKQMSQLIAEEDSALPGLLLGTLRAMLKQVEQLEEKVSQVEKQLLRLMKDSRPCQLLMSVPGVGLMTTTALAAATGGDVTHIKGGRSLACWLGITPKENSSGNKRRLGRISKQGDSYLRMLLVHGAPCYVLRRWRMDRASRWMRSSAGRCSCRPEWGTTRRRARWPTNWHAFATRA